MPRLVLVQADRKAQSEQNARGASHRAQPVEGEAAKMLLESNGFKAKSRVSNGQYEFACPFHETDLANGPIPRGHSTNFYLDRTSSMYFCQAASCGEKGNLQTLEKFFGIENDPTTASKYRSLEQRLQEYEQQLPKGERRQVFYDKGLNDATIERFRFGYDQEHGYYVLPYMEGRRPVGFRFYNPNHETTVRTHSQTGEVLKSLKYWWEKDTDARLFNVNDAIGDKNGEVFICEGEQKAALLTQMGYAAVAVPGANIWKPEWSQNFNHAKKIYVCLDNDNPDFHKRPNCPRCDTVEKEDCRGHNPGQDCAMKLMDVFGYRAKNIVLPLTTDAEGTLHKKTDLNEFFMRDGGTQNDFAALALGHGKQSPFIIRTLGEIRAEPPDEAVFLVDQGLLPKGGRLLVTGAPKAGKAQSLDAPVLTPSGWTTMGAITPGDRLVGSDGASIEVTHVWPQGEMDMFRVETNDGASLRVTSSHLWTVRLRSSREWTTVDTATLCEYLNAGETVWLPVLSKPVEFADQPYLPVDPYALGALIGDGSFRLSSPSFTSGDEEMFKHLADALGDYDVNIYRPQAAYISDPEASRTKENRLVADLKALNLWGHRSEAKFIPSIYLRGSVTERLALLQGLMDTDGGMQRMRSTFATSSPSLAEDVRELVESLGGLVTTRTKKTPRLDCYELVVRMPSDICPFRLSRKADAWWSSRPSKNMQLMRRIERVVVDGSGEAQCVTVRATDSLYVTDRFVLTHNSIFVENLALSIASGVKFLGQFPIAPNPNSKSDGHRVLLLDRELSERSLYDRLNLLIDKRPGYAAAEDKLLVDHKIAMRLDQPGAAATLINLIQANAADVIILDTAYKFFSGDMESSKNVATALASLDEAIAETGVSVILTHHHRKSGSNQGGKEQLPHPDQVVGSFLWTGWPNGTVLLNFLNRRVDSPFNTVASFVAFRDAAPPEPLALYRDRDSIHYKSVVPYSFDEGDDGGTSGRSTGNVRPLTYDEVAQVLLESVPVLEAEFLQESVSIFNRAESAIRFQLLDILDRHPDFVREGTGSREKPYIWKYKHEPDEEPYQEPELELGV